MALFGVRKLVVRQMNPILAATEEDILEEVNRAHARGNLRRWQHVIDTAEALGITQVNRDAMKDILTLMLETDLYEDAA